LAKVCDKSNYYFRAPSHVACQLVTHILVSTNTATGGYVGTVADNLPHSTRDVSVH